MNEFLMEVYTCTRVTISFGDLIPFVRIPAMMNKIKIVCYFEVSKDPERAPKADLVETA